MIKAAPKAAPADTPIRPGSAKGLRNKPCREAPAIPRLVPTSADSRTLGSLISRSTICCSGSELPKKIFGSEEGRVNLSELSQKDFRYFNLYLNSFGMLVNFEIENYDTQQTTQKQTKNHLSSKTTANK